MNQQQQQPLLKRVAHSVKKYATFIGPGLVVSVSYMDPGNYSTSVSSGSMYQYKLCFIIFMANLFAIILQALCVKLGTITGLDLAEMCRLHLNPKLNLFMYFCAEIAIIATDLAEVVGTAISLEILFGIPLLYGVVITVLDVLIILMAYHKDGSMKQTKFFEILVSILVAATCVCFILELFKCNFEPGSGWKIFKGFLPVNKEIFKESMALFLSCAIVGSTVMPHSLFLGSALVQPRLKEYDETHGTKANVLPVENEDTTRLVPPHQPVEGSRLRRISDGSLLTNKYKPSYAAIKYCLNYSYVELVSSLFIVAVFVNSAILIVAGSTLYGKPDAADADLLSIYEMLSYYISPAAGLVFALSMLFSGQSAGIVCTMAGQIISEGFINWTLEPWKRRIITRVLAIVPVIVVVGILGREGVSKVMNSSQVVLSFILPIVSAPLIYFTSKKEFMTVIDTSSTDESTPLLEENDLDEQIPVKKISFENGSLLRNASILTWVIITGLNVYLIIAFANGADI
ncbi:metal ion (Mn2+/Fe2+) transporter (Nramp) family metal ion transporter [Candida albicans L26]|uniref:Divalent metal ion transporter n=3 Tax=Candida albicans TaxID=5476 RepID=Q5ACZ8_CANAL|nr:putative divalent metal ion transporter [Candida albicans SC5314]KAF6068868.1 metal ion transporter, metal ion (Mn2+/Fe2+) transporter (Nramp) family protein [Candida albicans]KGQ89889.1 metal ion (Mn2+/Fe2+) transporter (Nramp) family metal ion transporter [Candida albicans P94015]KGQ96741.1 metal ion (Mn2+/Fe2+) transporter (Nramp) family metal ion transporter [Candida albicans P37005]KGR15926.1 metal ion (Mn2+/Fe2+) transporter (Nramp) family metal ion transporter [Candida albicans P78048|eukprot:XP_719516.1 putative divalent metal ion transporter [Candida albicans SC5314]